MRTTILSYSPLQGVLLHGAGGFAAGSFYAPLKKVKGWAWESSWLAMGVAAWAVTPWIAALVTTPHLVEVLHDSPLRSIGLAYLFGVLWGIGGMTFGLTMRYLGMALGMAVALDSVPYLGLSFRPSSEERSMIWSRRALVGLSSVGSAFAWWESAYAGWPASGEMAK